MPERLQSLGEKHDPVAVLCDAAGPAGSLLHQCDERGVQVEAVSASDHARACGRLFDMIDERMVRHLGGADLRSSIRGATSRPLGDAWAWSRKNSTVDISPLVAATLALWGAATLGWDTNEDPMIF